MIDQFFPIHNLTEAKITITQYSLTLHIVVIEHDVEACRPPQILYTQLLLQFSVRLRERLV